MLTEQCGFVPPPADAETIGGHISEQLGRIAQQGDSLCVGGFEVEVKEAGPMRKDESFSARPNGPSSLSSDGE